LFAVSYPPQMKVLVVEENSAIRSVIRQLVTSPGTWIQECVDSAHAIAAYAAGSPDFVIIDTGLKDLDGIEVSRQIKAMDPAARIVLVSDYDDAAMRESARRAGACGYVLKDNLLEVKHLLRVNQGEKA
jgi:DNA-binding NarL/FixJ family response regulator